MLDQRSMPARRLPEPRLLTRIAYKPERMAGEAFTLKVSNLRALGAQMLPQSVELLKKYKKHTKILSVVIGGQPCFSDLQPNIVNSSRI